MSEKGDAPMNPSEHSKRRLVKAVVRFLQNEAERSLPDRKESIEVAMQCLETAFDLEDDPDRSDVKPDEFLAMFLRNVPSDRKQITPEQLAQAEDYKNKGNDLMRSGLYKKAIDQYTLAIQINPDNAVYFCNRAAAFSRLENHESVIKDCEQAVTLDPNYSKAYGRLGIAYSNLSMHRKAKEAYLKALTLDPTNANYQENLRLAEERLTDEVGAMNAGNVDINQFMNNPSLLNMASQMLNDPGLSMSGILQMGNEGGNPNIDALLQMGQQLAEQMQLNNPGFVDHLRRQFAGDSQSTTPEMENSDTANTNKKEPPGSNDGDGLA